MLSRSYDKRIEIWQVSATNDGFGGFINTETFLFKKWAHIQTKNSIRKTENGAIENYYATLFNFRASGFNPNVKDTFLKYKGVRYVINTVENQNLREVDLIINATAYDGV